MANRLAARRAAAETMVFMDNALGDGRPVH
jgi:hypothetical protein